MLRGHKGPRRYARPMISPLGFRMVRSDVRIHFLGRFHIGGFAYFVWALPPNVGSCTFSVRVNTRGLPGDRHKGKKT